MSYCRRCGRRLTDPESVVLGIGPECYEKELYAERVQMKLFNNVNIPEEYKYLGEELYLKLKEKGLL